MPNLTMDGVDIKVWQAHAWPIRGPNLYLRPEWWIAENMREAAE